MSALQPALYNQHHHTAKRGIGHESNTSRYNRLRQYCEQNIIGYAPLLKLKETYAFIGESGGIFYDNGVITLHRYGQDPAQPQLPEAETDPDSSFIDAIIGKRDVAVSGEYALKVVKFTESIYAAAGYKVGSGDSTDLVRGKSQ